jgi:hypothetical protein
MILVGYGLKAEYQPENSASSPSGWKAMDINICIILFHRMFVDGEKRPTYKF